MSVYFAQAGPYTKVGYSADPVARSTSITRLGTRPADLPLGADAQLMGWIPGDRWREMELHVRFADRRVRGEWFTIDTAEVRELIWSDPRGIDLQRMSGLAVLAALRYPEATRDQMAEAGFRIEAVPAKDAIAAMNATLDRVVRASGAAS